MKKYILILSVLLFFGIFKFSEAAVLITNDNPNASTSVSHSLDASSPQYQSFTLGFAYNVSAVNVRVNEHITGSPRTLLFSLLSDSAGLPDVSSTLASSSLFSPDTSTSSLLSFSFSPLLLSPGKYWIGLKEDCSCDGSYWLYSATSTLSGGNAGYSVGNFFYDYDSQNQDFLFQVEISGSLSPALSASLLYPNVTTSTPDFNPWVYLIHNNLFSSPPLSVDFWYGTSSLAHTFHDHAGNITAPHGTSTYLLDKSQNLSPGTWYVAMTLSSGGTTYTEKDFSLNVLSGSQIKSPLIEYFHTPGGNQFSIFSTSTTAGFFDVDCSMYDNAAFFSSSTIANIGCQLQKLIYNSIGFLVEPPDFAQNALYTSVNNIKSVFPFSTIFGIVGAASTAASESASSSASGLTLHMGQYGDYPIFSANMLSDAVGSSTKEMIFTAEKSVIWIGSAWSVLGFIF